jgi:hypothetical protein
MHISILRLLEEGGQREEGSVIPATPVHDTSAEGKWNPRFKLKKHIISIKAHTNQHLAAKQIMMHFHAGQSISPPTTVGTTFVPKIKDNYLCLRIIVNVLYNQ